MLSITINKDNFAYIECNNEKLFNLILLSFTRKTRSYNNYYRRYEDKIIKYYSLIHNGTVIKVKAGLIPFLTNSFDERDIEYTLIDTRRVIQNISYSDIITKLSPDIELRDYQEDAVRSVFDYSYCCAQLPTGSGKSIISASIIKTYLNKNKRAVVYVVPTIKLQKDSIDLFKKCNIPVDKDLPFTPGCVTVTTYASMIRKDINKSCKDLVGLLIFDEAHHLKAPKSGRIIHDYKNLDMCVGLSATLAADIQVKTKLNKLAEQDFNIFGCVGYPAYFKSEKEAIKENFVTPVEIHILENPEYVYLEEYEISDWNKIKKKVLMSEKRCSLIAQYVKWIMQTKNFNTMCLLIPEVTWSKQFMIEISKYFDNNTHLYLTYGQDRYEEVIDGKIYNLTDSDKEKAIQNIKDSNVKTVFSATTYFYEGVDIPCMEAVLNVYGGKSTIRIKQQIGRTVRLFQGKKIAYVYEIKDDQVVLASQLRRRLNLYKNEYKANIILDNMEENHDNKILQ